MEIIMSWENQPDVICLQEVWVNAVKESLGQRLADRYPHQYQDKSKHKGAAVNSGLMVVSKYPDPKAWHQALHRRVSFGKAGSQRSDGCRVGSGTG